MTTYTNLLHDLQATLDRCHDAAAQLYLETARRELGRFNLSRHTLRITAHGLKVGPRLDTFYWHIRNEGQPVIVAIYQAGEALEQLPPPVLLRLIGAVI